LIDGSESESETEREGIPSSMVLPFHTCEGAQLLRLAANFSSHITIPKVCFNEFQFLEYTTFGVPCNADEILDPFSSTSKEETQPNPIHKHPTQTSNLDRSLVRDRSDGLGNVILHRNGTGFSGHGWLSLQVNVNTLILGLLLQCGVGLNSSDELFSGSGKGDVLDSEVDALLDVTVLDLLVDDDTDG